MDIRGTYVVDDLLAAAWLHVRRRVMVGAALAALLCMTCVLLGSQAPSAEFPHWVLWVPPILVLYVAILALFSIPGKVRREYAQRKDLRRQLTLSPSDNGLYLSTEVLSGERPWSDYSKWAEGRTVFLLYMSDSMFQVVPKRFFEAPADVQGFRELLARAVPRRVV